MKDSTKAEEKESKNRTISMFESEGWKCISTSIIYTRILFGSAISSYNKLTKETLLDFTFRLKYLEGLHNAVH